MAPPPVQEGVDDYLMAYSHSLEAWPKTRLAPQGGADVTRTDCLGQISQRHVWESVGVDWESLGSCRSFLELCERRWEARRISSSFASAVEPIPLHSLASAVETDWKSLRGYHEMEYVSPMGSYWPVPLGMDMIAE